MSDCKGNILPNIFRATGGPVTELHNGTKDDLHESSGSVGRRPVMTSAPGQ